MLTLLFLLAFTFVGITFFGYGVHWMLHQKWMGKYYTAHMAHHEKLYPPTDFLSETYRDAGAESTFWFFLISGAPLVILPVVLLFLGKLSFFVTALVVIEAVTLGLVSNYLHDSFHIKDHFLNFFSWFKTLVKLHYQHHVDMNTNFGIFFFLWDKLFKTFR